MPRIYPEGGTANIGDRRWEVEWWVLKPGVTERIDNGDDFNPDADQYAEVEFYAFDNHEAAQQRAQQVCDEHDQRNLSMAIVTVQEQQCDWFERDMSLAEWINVSEAEYFDEPHEKVVAA